MKLLLDTNILMDYYSRRAPFYENTIKLRVAEVFGDVELWASGISFADIEYVFRSSVGVEPLRTAFLASLSFLRICMPCSQDVKDSFSCGWPDLEDYLISSAARRIDADFIVTRDEKGFVESTVPALSPADFFDYMFCEHGVTYDNVRL